MAQKYIVELVLVMLPRPRSAPASSCRGTSASTRHSSFPTSPFPYRLQQTLNMCSEPHQIRLAFALRMPQRRVFRDLESAYV